ncbi:MAG: hypothetical protein U1E89_01390 [Burkholderiaceae bacterium]
MSAVAGSTVIAPRRVRRPIAARSWLIAALVLTAVAVVLVAADIGVGRWQERAAEARKLRRQQVERLAWYELRADVAQVDYGEGGGYRMTVWMENVFPEHDFYVMAPAIRAFVQVGPRWVELPVKELRAPDLLASGAVVNLKDKRHAGVVFDVTEPEFFDLLPGYMHMRFDNTLFVSPEAQPKDDIVERQDTYYIHLRPRDADDERLRRLNRFAGPVPLWIGMPPH